MIQASEHAVISARAASIQCIAVVIAGSGTAVVFAV